MGERTECGETPRTLLLIDDNAVDRELVARYLPNRFRLLQADTAEHGLAHVEGGRVDCVLLDYLLPDSDGFDVLLEIVKSGVPVVVLTGHGDHEIAREAVKHGAAGSLFKDGLDRAVLARTIDAAIVRGDLGRALERREAQLRALTEKLPAIVWTVDRSLTLTSVSGARLEAARLSADASKRQHVDALFAPVLEDAAQRKMLAFAHADALDGRAAHCELRINARTYDGHIVPLVGASGKNIGASGLLLDVTESRALERQLLQSQKLEAIGQLAGGLAHDLNNILTAVVSFTSFAREAAPPETQLIEDLDEVLRASERGTALLRQLLVFSRRETLDRSSVDVKATLDGTLPMLRRLLGEDVRIDVVEHEEEMRVRIDKSELEQIIVNLGVNARDAMRGAGRIIFDLSCTTFERPTHLGPDLPLGPGSYLVLAVTDTGEGIPPDIMARVFEPFFTTKERGQGTGLGLSTCYGIARRGEGTIAIESEPGRGTTVRLYLPLSAEAVALPETHGRMPTDARGGTETVLCVEDDSVVRAATVRVLRRLGYRVIEAEDVETAIAAERAFVGPIDLVLADTVLPGGSGRDVVEHILSSRPRARVLYVSGYAPESLHLRGLFDVVEILEKPFTLRELARRVRHALDVESPVRIHA